MTKWSNDGQNFSTLVIDTTTSVLCLGGRGELIMLKNLPTMLCCTALKEHLLC